uniref:Uncharacterized protein n=1 Tax=Magallana gigas TaxID=29159 RepID=A0A8W8IC55_MAGGI
MSRSPQLKVSISEISLPGKDEVINGPDDGSPVSCSASGVNHVGLPFTDPRKQTQTFKFLTGRLPNHKVFHERSGEHDLLRLRKDLR